MEGVEDYLSISKFAKNPWHKVSPGKEAPKIVNAVIQIPKGSKAKYELDKDSGMLKLDRILFSAVHYPANYGFIPQTYCDDKDPLDILVLCSIELEPLCLVEARVIGYMHMIDQGEIDDKVIAVANKDPTFSNVNEMKDLPPYTEAEIKRFFEDYQKLENKKVVVDEFGNREAAYKIIEESIVMYKDKYSPEALVGTLSLQKSLSSPGGAGGKSVE